MAPRKKNTDAAPKKGAKKKPTKAEQTAAHVASDDIERVQVWKDVPQIAEAQEAQRQAHELAKVTLELKQHETELASFGADKRKKMRPLRKEQQRLANAVDGNTIMKRMHVYEVRDYKLNQCRYVASIVDGKEGPAVPGLDPVVMPVEMRQRTLFEGDADGPRVAAEEEDEEVLDDEEELEEDE